MKVTLFKKTGCVYCDQQEEHMMACGLLEEFSVVTITEENRAKIIGELSEKTGQRSPGLPIIIIETIRDSIRDEGIIVGYNPEIFDASILEARAREITGGTT